MGISLFVMILSFLNCECVKVIHVLLCISRAIQNLTITRLTEGGCLEGKDDEWLSPKNYAHTNVQISYALTRLCCVKSFAQLFCGVFLAFIGNKFR
jgi:hypothetical protein